MKKETTNFTLLYYSNNTQDINEIADVLENNFERITGLLGVVPSGKTRVHIYASQSDFHQAIGRSDAKAWVVGTVMAGEIHMVSPSNPGPESDRDGIMSVAIHEFVHIVANKLSLHTTDNYPFLAEGLATYLAGQVCQLDLDLDVPSVDTIISSCESDDVYQVGFVFMQFIANAFGNDGLVALYKDPDAFVRNNPGLDEIWLSSTKKTISPPVGGDCLTSY